jgi:hypothetical protein
LEGLAQIMVCDRKNPPQMIDLSLPGVIIFCF